MTESKTITLSRTLAATVAGVSVMCLFCGGSFVASIVIEHQGEVGDGAPYLEFAGRWVQYIGWLVTGGVLGHAGRHWGRNTPSGVDPE